MVRRRFIKYICLTICMAMVFSLSYSDMNFFSHAMESTHMNGNEPGLYRPFVRIQDDEHTQDYRNSLDYSEDVIILKQVETTSLFRSTARPVYPKDKFDSLDIGISASNELARKQTGNGIFRNEYEVTYIYEITDSQRDIWSVIDTLSEIEGIIDAEPEFIYTVSSSGIPDDTTDPLIESQWYLEDLRMSEVWEEYYNEGIIPGEDVVVAVIDTGVDYTHEDLVDNMWINYEEYYGEQGVDDDGNGYIDDIYGINTSGDNSDPMDDHGHGTHVAGIIAMTANNNKGGAGISYGAKIMAIKAGDEEGELSSIDIVEGIYYALDNGADIINMSFGGEGNSFIIEDALQNASEQSVLVAAAGNDGDPDAGAHPSFNDRKDIFPAAYPFVIGVMAYDENRQKASFSNWSYTGGETLTYEIIAPGVKILSTWLNNGYAYSNGTSMAAPAVSAAVAILKNRFESGGEPLFEFYRDLLVEKTTDKVTYTDSRGTVHEYPGLSIYESIQYPEVEQEQIVGSVQITGVLKFDETLEADVSAITPENAELEYQWKRDGVNIDGETNSLYTVVREDIDRQIAVIVTGTGDYTGSITSDSVIPAKADGPGAPAKPVVSQKSWDEVVLEETIGYEYKMDDGAWQQIGIFENLDPNTEYTLYQRVAETDTHFAGETSEGLEVRTDRRDITGSVSITGIFKFAQDLTADISDIIPVEADISYQWYRNEEKIQEATTFTYTVAQEDIGREITVVVTGIGDYEGSIISDSVMPAKADGPEAPDAPKVSEKTWNKVVLEETAGYEYRVGEGLWQQNGIFENLDPDTEYTFYQRVRETSTHKASVQSNGLTVETDSKPIQPRVDFIAPSLTAEPEENVFVDLNISATANIGAMTIELNYDPEKLEYLNSQQGTDLSEGMSDINHQPGQVVMAYINIDGFSGDGVFLSIEFKAIGEIGDISLLELIVHELADVDTYEEIPYDITNGQVEIKAVEQEISGSVNITGEPVFDEELTADITNIIPSDATLSYLWKRNDIAITGATDRSYRVVQADIGQQITVTVTGTGDYTGTITSESVIPARAVQTASPATPVLLSKTSDTIIVNTVAGHEYRLNNGPWQTEGVFSGLNPDTLYSIYSRLAQTNTHLASGAGLALEVRTDSAKINTDIFFINTARTFISRISLGKTISEFLEGIKNNATVKVFKGNEQVEETEILATGMKIRQYSGNTVTDELTIVVTGDITGNGRVGLTDYVRIKSHLLGKTVLEGEYAAAADVNADGRLSLTDYIGIKAHLLEKQEITPQEHD